METHRLLAELKSKMGLSVRTLETRSGVSKSAIQRALVADDRELLPRGATLDLLLQKGFKMKPEHPEYKKIVGVWTRERLQGYHKKRKVDPDALKKQAMMARVANLTPAKLAKLQKLMKGL